MKPSSLKLACGLLAVLLQAACVTAPMSAAPQPQASVSFLLGPELTCPNVGVLCVVQVNVTTMPGPQGQGLCAVTVRSPIKFSGTVNGVDRSRWIVWVLTPHTISTYLSYTFAKNNTAFQNRGLVITDDSAYQLFGLDIGGDQGTDDWKYHAINRQNLMNSGASYLPVVIQTDTSTSPATVTLCAAADPKIVNTN